jgi:tripartite ATP-independent transporter DctP family solute receptor
MGELYWPEESASAPGSPQRTTKRTAKTKELVMLTKTRFTLAFVAACLLMAPAANAEMTLRAGTVLPPTSDQGQAADFFAKRVDELTNGEIKVQVFYSGEIGTPPVQFENLIAGAQDLVIDTMDYLASYDSRMGILNTPFVFSSRAHLQKFLLSDVFKPIQESVEDHGMVFLSDYNWIRQQDRGLLTRTPIVTPDQVQGFKLRMFQAEMPIHAWSALGANVQVIAWGEVYTALATGAVDGLTTTIAASYGNKHTEILKYFTNLDEYYQIVVPVISKITWDKLTDDQKAALQQAAHEAGEEYVRLSAEQNDADINAAETNDGLQMVDRDVEAWNAAARDLHKKLAEEGMLDLDLAEAIYALND